MKDKSCQDADSLWKDVIEDFFEDFMKFFAPKLCKMIDFEKGYEFLEQELRKVFPDSKKRQVDKLIKVYLKNGTEKWILVHVEVQEYLEREFSKRMFTYFYRIYDKYQKDIYAIAIFAESNKNFKPDTYHYKLYETELIYKYKAYKILEQDEEELKKSSNIFALVILAGLYAIKAKGDIDKRYRFKKRLIKLLLEREYAREEIKKMFKFVESLMYLPEEVNIKLVEEIEKEYNLGGERRMGLDGDKSIIWKVLNEKAEKAVFQKGEQEGIQEGIQKGKLEVAKKLIARGMEVKEVAEIAELPEEEIKKLMN